MSFFSGELIVGSNVYINPSEAMNSAWEGPQLVVHDKTPHLRSFQEITLHLFKCNFYENFYEIFMKISVLFLGKSARFDFSHLVLPFLCVWLRVCLCYQFV